MTAWLSIVGIGEDGAASLAPAARTLVETAEVVIGGQRHLDLLPECFGQNQERLPWPSPMSDLLERIPSMRGRRVCVLATGDPMLFGVGATLAAMMPPVEMTVVPSVSAFSLAAARVGWPLDSVKTVTLHGRPVATLACHVHPGARLLILGEDSRTPLHVAEWLTEHGFGESRMTALAHMGGPKEERLEGPAARWTAAVPAFHTLAVECRAGRNARWWPATAGLPDDAYEHDGQLTKREARALAVAKLMPWPGALLWDIGAGCGSIGIEWMRAANNAQAIAVESDPARRAIIARNAASLGVPQLDIREGSAPAILKDLPSPDACFIGGGLSEETVATAMEALNPGGRLVAHAVTLETETLLSLLYRERGGELVRIAVARAAPVGGLTGWRPAMPVTQWAWRKE
jgi:precorrin-6Y C5,15-methyltransferase (decarboxylating)